MNNRPRRSGSCAVITGVGESAVGKIPHMSSLGLHAVAGQAALSDADLTWSAVDGLITVGSFVDPFPRQALTCAEYLGIAPQLKMCHAVEMGGASSAMGVVHAITMVEQGICDTVLVIAADNLRTGMTTATAVSQYAKFRHPEYEYPLGLLNPGAYALIAQRHMSQYGTRPEHLAMAVEAVRSWAMDNPTAAIQQPVTVEEVLASELVADPLHKLECSLISDGGAALVIQRRDRAARPERTVWVAGYGMGFEYDHIVESPDLTTAGCRLSGQRAFDMAGLSPIDVDFAELYDCYSIAILLQLEAFGFCATGESGPFVQSGGIRRGAGLPVVTHGGLLCHAHPGAPGGVFHLTEAVRQLRGEAGPRQVAGAKVGLVHGEGGILSANCTLMLTNTDGV